MNKKKLFITLASGLAVITLTATTVFAANGSKELIARVDADTQKVEYSSDGGKTWSTEAPQELEKSASEKTSAKPGFSVNKDGSVSISDDKAKETPGGGTLARINADTQQVEYSSDGGKTWSKQAPSNLNQPAAEKETLPEQPSLQMNADGSVAQADSSQKGTGIVARIDSETEEVDYSVDNGATWSTKRPAELDKDQ